MLTELLFDDDESPFGKSDEHCNRSRRTNSMPTGEKEMEDFGRVFQQYYAEKISADILLKQPELGRLCDIMNSEEFQRQHHTCLTCGVSWFDDQISLACFECGGYSMARPCPICNGKCGKQWKRDVTMSHSMREAHWVGECGLPPNEQQAFMLRNLTDSNEQYMVEAMKDLKTNP